MKEIRVYYDHGEEGIDHDAAGMIVADGVLLLINEEGDVIHAFARGNWIEAEIFPEEPK